MANASGSLIIQTKSTPLKKGKKKAVREEARREVKRVRKR